MSTVDIDAPQTPLKFHGSAGEYFRIWMVNVLLTIVTLGFYSPWAKVRRKRYLYGNLDVAGHRFDYLADPVKILKGRLIALAFLFVYYLASLLAPALSVFLLAALIMTIPYIVVTSAAFQMRNTSYRNVRFRFEQNFGQAYKSIGVPLFIAVLIAGIFYGALELLGGLDEVIRESEAEGDPVTRADMFLGFVILAVLPVIPWLDYARVSFIVNRTHYGKDKADYLSSGGAYYLFFLKVGLIFGATMFVLGAFFSGLFDMLDASWPGAGNTEPGMDMLATLIEVLIFVAVGYAVFTIVVGGYFRAAHTNLIFGNIRFPQLRVHSCLKMLEVGWLYFSNAVAIVFSLGFLIPWASIRMIRYVADRTSVQVKDLDSIVAAAQSDQSAFGEEMGEVFDLDFGL